MQKRRTDRDNTQKVDVHEPVQLRKFEVTLEECDGDYSKMLKKFSKKVRKHEILKPYYERLMFHMTKSQKRRKKRLNAIYEQRKNQSQDSLLELETEKQMRQVEEKKQD